jgi:hypothetical protein
MFSSSSSGQLLVDACKSAGVLLGEWSIGDPHGSRTFLRGPNPSVIDYCLLDPALYTSVRSFEVQQKIWHWGDYAPLLVVVGLGFLLIGAGQAGGDKSGEQQQQPSGTLIARKFMLWL